MDPVTRADHPTPPSLAPARAPRDPQNIDASKLVIKIDTEGAERDIIIQLAPFIAQYKPSMLLSFVRRAAAAAGGSDANGVAGGGMRR